MESLTLLSFGGFMKLFALFLPVVFSFFAATTAAAHPNPQFRVCNERGGEFVVADNTFDQIGLCKVGNSYIGTIDLMNFFYENKSNLSVSQYSAGVISCPTLVTSTSLEGATIQLCVYEDNSVLDFQTVMNSKYSFENAALNLFLGIAD